MEPRTYIIHSATLLDGISLGLKSCNENRPDILRSAQDLFHQVANADGFFRPGFYPD